MCGSNPWRSSSSGLSEVQRCNGLASPTVCSSTVNGQRFPAMWSGSLVRTSTIGIYGHVPNAQGPKRLRAKSAWGKQFCFRSDPQVQRPLVTKKLRPTEQRASRLETGARKTDASPRGAAPPWPYKRSDRFAQRTSRAGP